MIRLMIVALFGFAVSNGASAQKDCVAILDNFESEKSHGVGVVGAALDVNSSLPIKKINLQALIERNQGGNLSEAVSRAIEDAMRECRIVNLSSYSGWVQKMLSQGSASLPAGSHLVVALGNKMQERMHCIEPQYGGSMGGVVNCPTEDMRNIHPNITVVGGIDPESGSLICTKRRSRDSQSCVSRSERFGEMVGSSYAAPRYAAELWESI